MRQGLQYKKYLVFTSKILVLRWAGILRFLRKCQILNFLNIKIVLRFLEY